MEKARQRMGGWCLLALGLTGCVIGFDEERLRQPASGPSTPGLDGGALPVNDAAGSDGGTLAGDCDDFSGYAPGELPTSWQEGRGTWRIVDESTGHALGQLTDPQQGQDLFLAWRDAPDDVRVTATIDAADDEDNCVIARVSDKDNYYKLCVGPGRQRNDEPSWRLALVLDGENERLADGPLAATGRGHVISLVVQGARLVPTIDGATQPGIDDDRLASGEAGVATRSSGVFTKVCMGAP